MGLLGYWRRRRGIRVYQNIAQHWLERDAALPDDVLPHLDGDVPEDSESQPPDSIPERPRRLKGRRSRSTGDDLELRVPTRHVLLLASTAVVLLLIVAVLSTVLILRSC